jgi:hypothetical protein
MILTMIHTSDGQRMIYEGELSIHGTEAYLSPDKLYIFESVMSKNGEIVMRPIRIDNTPFCPDGDVHLLGVSQWWVLSEKSEMFIKFSELKKINSAQKAGLVL